MKALWLHQQQKDKLLLFLNGWGMDEKPFAFLANQTFDILMLHDYTDLTIPFDPAGVFSAYREVYVLAWSLGVWVCQILKDVLPAHTVFSVAVNGTLQPIHAKYGIAPSIFDSTLRELSPATLQNFYANMFPEETTPGQFLATQPQRAFAQQRLELECLRTAITSEPAAREAMGFDLAIIGNRDVIIPAKNQIRFWKNQSTCELVSAGHFPFYLWRSWEDIFVYISHE